MNIVRTVVPDVVFSYNQHQAHLMLVATGNIKKFNTYCAGALTKEQRQHVLDNTNLDDIC